LAIPEHTVAANLFSEPAFGSTSGARSTPSNCLRNTFSRCSQSLSFISAGSFYPASSALVSLSGMGPVLLRHPAATPEITSPKKSGDATYPKALIAPTLSGMGTRPRSDSQADQLTCRPFSSEVTEEHL